MTSYRLAASAEMLFLDLPFVERVKRIHERGFAVEIWGWLTKDLTALAKTGADFNSMTGYIEGDLIEADGIANLLATAEKSIEASNVINCRNLNLHGTGLDDQGQAIRKRNRSLALNGQQHLTLSKELQNLVPSMTRLSSWRI